MSNWLKDFQEGIQLFRTQKKGHTLIKYVYS